MNQHVFKKLPQVELLIASAFKNDAKELSELAFKAIGDSLKSVTTMNPTELQAFDAQLFETLLHVLNDPTRRYDGYLQSDIKWSICQDSKNDNFLDDNDVSGHISDGVYKVKQFNYSTNLTTNLRTKVLVWKGKIDIESCKEAVCEFLNWTGDSHIYIEGVDNGEEPNTIRFILGS